MVKRTTPNKTESKDTKYLLNNNKIKTVDEEDKTSRFIADIKVFKCDTLIKIRSILLHSI